MNHKKSRQWGPWFLFLFGVAGITGFSAWNWISVRQAMQITSQRWVERVSVYVVAERASLVEWIDRFTPAQAAALAVVSRSRTDLVTLLLIDQKNRTSQHWTTADFAGRFEPMDPRLGVLQLTALESGKTQVGPVLFVNHVPYATVVRPVDLHRVLMAFVRMPQIVRHVETEATLWHVRPYVFDYEKHPIFLYAQDSTVSSFLGEVMERVRGGTATGILSSQDWNTWQWLMTYHYDPGTDWVFIVQQFAPWVYAPFFFFLISLGGALLLARTPYRAMVDLEHSAMSNALANFSARVDNFVRGRDNVLNEPPHPYKELTPIVLALRWMMPQWKKAESFPRELGLERKLLALLIESLPEGILFFNAQGGLQLANELGRVFLTLQQEAGKEYKVINGIQIPRGFLEPFVEPVFTSTQPNLGKEVEVPWADGKHLYRVWIERVEGDPGKTLGFIAVVRDITFRKQWEYVQEQVLSGITHDLRGPLSAVMGYLDLSRRTLGESVNPKVAEYLKLAREAGVRLSQMVSDILDVVRFEQGKVDIELESIPVVQIFQRLQNTFGVMSEQKKINLKLQIHGDPSLTVVADRKHIDRVFDNLIGNAIKFTPTEGSITISAKKADKRIFFEVADTGRGIPREAQSRIFDKFQQVRPGDRSKGYGLGLAVVKFIVEAHKGEIHVESEVEKGSRFIFWLPDIPAPIPSVMTTEASSSTGPSAG